MNCQKNDIEKKPIDLNTEENAEYQHWIRLVREVCDIQKILSKHPDRAGLQQARTKAYNVLADIQIIIDLVDSKTFK